MWSTMGLSARTGGRNSFIMTKSSSSLVEQVVIKGIVRRPDIKENFVNFYRFMLRRKLYARPAASHTCGTVVIISQECMIDLNRERVGPARDDGAENRQKGRVNRRVVGNFSGARICAQRALWEREKGKSARARALPLLSRHEIYSENWDTFLGEREAKKREYREAVDDEAKEGEQKLWRAKPRCNNISGS